MVTKSKAANESNRIKVGKLKVNKETVKDLTTAELKQVKGGWIRPPDYMDLSSAVRGLYSALRGFVTVLCCLITR